MKLLLDTHTFIWWDSVPNKLSTEVLSLFQDQANEMILSVASIWEMQIKLQLGKLQLNSPLREIITTQQETNNIKILDVSLVHILALEELPTPHKDPFDRLLVAQTIAEDAILVSRDKMFKQYPIKLLW